MIALLAAAFVSCGSERVMVKNLRDHPNLLPMGSITIAQLRALKAPRWRNRAPRWLVERQVVTVEAEVLAYKTEADGDLHVIIRSAPGVTMIVELPAASCVVASPYAAQMRTARATFLGLARARVQRMRSTAKALLVEVEGEQTWVPKSCIHDDSEVWRDDSEPGELVVKAWFARKEGWE